MTEKVLKAIKSINNKILALAGIFLFLSTALAVVNAVMRFSNLGGIAWGEEVSTLLVVVMVFLSQSFLEYNDDQLCISILQSTLKNDKWKRFFHIIRGLATLFMTGLLLYYAVPVTVKAYERNLVTQVLHFPRYILYGFMIINFVLTIISWLATIFLAKGKPQKDSASSVEALVSFEEDGGER